MKMKSKIKFAKFLQSILPKVALVLFLGFMFMTPVVSLAQSNNPSGTMNGAKIETPRGVESRDGFIKIILEGVVKIGIPLIVLAIVYSGFLFVFARGNETKLKEAKNALAYTLIGAAVVLGSWTLAILISETVIKIGS